MTLKDYYKRFGGLLGVLAGLLSSIPFISKFFPQNVEQYMFPPLGTFETTIRFSAVGLAVLTTFIGWKAQHRSFALSSKGRWRRDCFCWLLIIIGLVGFLVSSHYFTRSIPVPSRGEDEQIIVSVGCQRTEFARKEFDRLSDEEMLRRRGPTEEEIWRLWTSSSIIASRCALLLAWLCCILPAVGLCSLAVLYDGLGPPSTP